MQRDSNQPPSDDTRVQLERLQRRQALRIAMAVLLVWLAISSSSKGAGLCGSLNPCGLPIQLDGFTPATIDVGFSGRPSPGIDYVQLHAELANFDRDLHVDGWLASVALRNLDQSVLVPPASVAQATAIFEVLDHAGLVAAGRNGDWGWNRTLSLHPGLVWTVPLEFNEFGVAAITLPASRSAQRSLGWDSTDAIHLGTRVADDHGPARWRRVIDGGRHRPFVTRPVRDEIDLPRIGWLRVSVTIPGQRTMEAAVPIDLRPAVLVDTYGRSR